jgi:hypothetical protein
MAVVITHPEMGIYLGNCMGLGFWTLLDPIGQPEAVAFPDASDAAQHITSWDSHNNPAEYSFVTVQATDYASIAALKAAGLADLLGDMEIDALRYAEPAGSA